MIKKFPTIIGSTFILRQINTYDIDNIYFGLSNPEVIKYYGVNYDSLSQTQQQMEWFRELEETETGIWWVIVNIKNDDFYGAIGLNNLNKIHRKAEIGFWLLPNFWGKGIMSGALKLITNYAFKDLNLHRIEAMVETENINSKKLLQKLNFSFEGTFVDYEIKNESFISIDVYAKLSQ